MDSSENKKPAKSASRKLYFDIIPPKAKSAPVRQTVAFPGAKLSEESVAATPRPFQSFQKEKDAAEIEKTLEDFFSRGREEEKELKKEKASKPAPEVKVHAYPKTKKRMRVIWLWTGSVIGAFVAVGFFLSTMFQHATLSVEPVTNAFPLTNVTLHVSPDTHVIDPTHSALPGEFIEFTDTKTNSYAATGKSVVSEKAHGTVQLMNNYSSAPQVLVQGTRLLSDGGKLFRLEHAVTIPGANVKSGTIVPSSITTTVVADAPGVTYNIQPSAFHFPGFKGTLRYRGFVAKSDAPFSGGFEGSAVVVTADDLKKASEQITSDAVVSMRDSLKVKTPDGFSIIDGAREITIINIAAPSAGNRVAGGTFSVAATVRARAIAFRPDDENAFIAAIASTSSAQKLLPDQSKLSRTSVSLDIPGRALTYDLSGNAVLGALINSDSLRDQVLGKTEGDLAGVMGTLGGVKRYSIKLFPLWLRHVPGDPAKVNVTVLPYTL